MKRAVSYLLDLLFPPKCAFCGALMEHTGSGVCPRCSSALPFLPDNRVLREVNTFPAAVTFYYDEPVSTGIKALKFRKTPWRAKIFARYLAQTAAEYLGGQFDEITFDEVYSRNLKVMDLTAFTLCRENRLNIVVFDMDTPGNLGKVLAGEAIGTVVKC